MEPTASTGPTADAAAWHAVDAVEARLFAAANPQRAEGEARYLKSVLADPDRIHLGVSVPACRAILRSEFRAVEPLGRDQLMAVVEHWWSSEIFEFKRVATEAAVRNWAAFHPTDISLIEAWMRTARTWALIDEWAPRVVGPLLERDTLAVGPVVDRWATDGDFWIRRSAILSMLLGFRRGEGDWDRFSRIVDPLLNDPEFFIRKAIGWVLREAGSSPKAGGRSQETAVRWIETRAQRLSGLSFREATRKLPEPIRVHLQAARTDG